MGCNNMNSFERSYDCRECSKNGRIWSFIITLMLLLPYTTNAQVVFSSTVLILDDKTTVKEIRLTNLSDVPQEVEIINRFGYPVTKENGQPLIHYPTDRTDSAYSLNPYLRVYPSKVIIPARTRQIVRVQVETSEDLIDQVYWSRLGIRSRAIAEEVGNKEAYSNHRFSYVIQQNMGVYFKKGIVHTALELDSVRFSTRNDTLHLVADVRQVGNSPYFGIATITVKNKAGDLIAETDRVISVFFESNIAATLVLPDLNEQKYVLDIRFETERADIPEQDMILANDQIFSREIEVMR